jgi:ribosomal protein S26
MPRILLLIALVWILYQMIKRLAASARQTKSTQNKASEKMVQCSQCGCHVPASESVIKDNLTRCNNPQCHQ